MNHPGDLLSALLDGELARGEHRDVTAHLDGCEQCRADFEAITSARSALRSLPVLDPPEGLLPEPRLPRRLWWQRPVLAWAAAGAAALAVAIGLVAGTTTPPEPMDLGDLAGQHTARVLVQPGFQTVRAELEAP